MSGNRIGIKSAKGTSTSGYVTKSKVNKNLNKQHRYLHDSDMEYSDEEQNKNKRQIDINELVKNKKIKLNNEKNPNVLINKYFNNFIDYIEDNNIKFNDHKDDILHLYKQKLLDYYKSEKTNTELPRAHDLLNYERQVKLLSNKFNIDKGNTLQY
ncbi:uncharacterized protein HGUI_01026 [Hanseniaspora guilliermondii]|uniref:Pre-mRNA-splicing factor CWC21 n=1 Tax=Hanseniaspora guilliermondii TaxID=56406 RepID=A0A1L0AX25_9ASCO|nr:uncharacterized protein HGUI_01026 [Hanseniaspora guilliermondii]